MNKDLDELFSRGVGTFVDPNNTFRNNLEKKIKGQYDKDITIKFGVDPTRPDIHLGHAVVLRKLRQFQDLGCKVIFLIGDITASIGDPSGKSKVRPELDQKEINQNMETFLAQVGNILKTEPEVFSWIRNSDWFVGVTDIQVESTNLVKISNNEGSLSFSSNDFIGKAAVYQKTRMQTSHLNKKSNISGFTLLNLLSVLRKITHSRLIARDMFQERIGNEDELYLNEMMYPVLQGVDSVMLAEIYDSCDMEIGGTDQTFNMLMGRDVMKISNLPEQAVLALEILPGLDGVEKMSKSLNNYVTITDTPSEMFGKIMSIPDSVIAKYFELATYTPVKEVRKIEKEVEGGKTNPKDLKIRLAHEITAIYYGKQSAKEAETDFIETFSNNSVPKDIETIKAAAGTELVEILILQNIVKSKSDWRRLVEGGAVSNIDSGQKIDSAKVKLEEVVTLRVGKHRFIKIEPL